jgi:hypothetical protein
MRVVIAVAVGGLVLLTGCPATGIVCNEGTIGCNAGCVDPAVDKRNCGGCGQSCGADQECVASTCVDTKKAGDLCNPNNGDPGCGLVLACNGLTNKCAPYQQAKVGEPCGFVASGDSS